MENWPYECLYSIRSLDRGNRSVGEFHMIAADRWTPFQRLRDRWKAAFKLVMYQKRESGFQDIQYQEHS